MASPDIAMLPDISVFFGVSIDELFALSDDTRMERIQNMLWDVRFLDRGECDAAREFLLQKATREPGNGRPHELLADLELHVAKGHREKAAEYALEAMARDPGLMDAHGSLVEAMSGATVDWCYVNHYVLIDQYKDYIEAHPDCVSAYLYLMDQLVDDSRLAEAAEYCEKLAAFYNGYQVLLYRGIIAWWDGQRERAFAIWQQMEQEFPEKWQVYHNIGDYLVRSGRYEEAKTYYRKALDKQSAPRYVDPCEALAQVCVIQGDIPGAIEALEEELALCEIEWHFTTGESADYVRREIARLKCRLKD